jgi:zinc transporter 9
MHVHDSKREDCAQGGAIKGLNATLGLVIHGAADGIALGASSLSDKGNLGLIVFVAVLVHKGKNKSIALMQVRPLSV